MAKLESDYQSVKDYLPLDDGKHYDVICIVQNVTIEHSYNYRIGTYNNGMFQIDGAFYAKKNNFRCTWKPERVIAWKPLDKASREKIHEFYEKAGN